MKKRPLRIFLCDLTHDTVVLVSDTIPVNIGFIGAFAKKVHGDQIELPLFKYPQTAIDAINTDPPDVLALSNYSWNSKLSERLARFAKTVRPATVTVQGGTNFPHTETQQLAFLLSRPATDCYVELEAEIAFANFLSAFLDARDGGNRLFSSPLSGITYIVPESRGSDNPILVKGEMPDRIKDLDKIPSPYLSGLLDTFFDGRLTPFLETNRGCPFRCSFCQTGEEYFQKINMFSYERIVEEIRYIAPRAASFGIVNLHLADTNFGMYARDKQICEALLDSQAAHGWPRQSMATTGKNNKERVIAITDIMGDVFSVNMSVQSMDPQVLTNIKRDNISLDAYKRINEHLNEQGRSTKGELIIGLPGETKESFVAGLDQIIAAGASNVILYSLMLLHGTEFKDPDYRKKFQVKGKYRIVPLNFGEYAGEKVFDTEEVGIATDSMSFEDYLWIRGLCLIVEATHNNHPYEELIRYGLNLGLTRFELIREAYDRLDSAPSAVQDVLSGFMRETLEELWESDQDLEAHHSLPDNYARLLAGDAGGNLIYKYKAISLAFCSAAWAEFLGTMLLEMATDRRGNDAGTTAKKDIEILVAFVKNKLLGLLDADGDVQPAELESPYDVVKWCWQDEGKTLQDCAFDSPRRYVFEYTPEQLAARHDYFRRYGTDANGLSKIVTRVSNVESLFRKIRLLDSGPDTPNQDKQENDQFIRYTLSN